MRDTRTFPELYGGSPPCSLSPKEAREALTKLDRQSAKFVKWIRITLDPPHWNGIAGHSLRECLVVNIVPYHIQKHRQRRRYQDLHAEGHEPRRVVRVECPVCGELFARPYMGECTWCSQDMCTGCGEEHVGFCTPECMSNHQWSIAGIGRR